MKKIGFFLASVAFFVSGVAASAQFVNQGGSGRSAAPSSAEVEAVFNTFDFTYSPFNLKAEGGGESATQEMNALSLNWAQARALTTAYPVYLQYGVGLQYAWKTDSDSEDYHSYKETMSFLTAKIPVNLMYCFNVPQTNVALMPYVGLNLQGHILGQTNWKETYDGESESGKVNYFSDEDMEDNTYNRIVLGWQIGAKVAFNKYFVGIAYEGPVTNLFKYDGDGDYKINTNQINISIGMKF